MSRSKGSLEFSKHCGSPAELAARLEVSQATISLWRSGKRKPIEARRLQLESPPPVGCGIPRAWWDEEVEAPALTPVPPTAPRDPSSITTLAQVQEATIALAKDFIAAAQQCLKNAADPSIDPREQAGILRAGAPTIQALSKLAGSMLELSPEQIVRAPAFALIRERIVAALDAYPEARDAVIAALEGVPAPEPEEPENDAIDE